MANKNEPQKSVWRTWLRLLIRFLILGVFCGSVLDSTSQMTQFAASALGVLVPLLAVLLVLRFTDYPAPIWGVALIGLVVGAALVLLFPQLSLLRLELDVMVLLAVTTLLVWGGGTYG